jgi:hypothetical protein
VRHGRERVVRLEQVARQVAVLDLGAVLEVLDDQEPEPAEQGHDHEAEHVALLAQLRRADAERPS